MDRMGYPRGLVRYATERGLSQHLGRGGMLRHVLRPRVLVYGTLLLGLTVALFGSLALRNPLRVDVIRDRNALARIVEDGWIENTYRLHFMNASESPQRLRVSVEGLDGLRIDGPLEHEVAAASNRAVPVSVRVPPGTGQPGANPIRFRVEAVDDPSIDRDEKTTFVVPR
jgi:polyferredoxin